MKIKTTATAITLTLCMALAVPAYAARSAVPLIEPARVELLSLADSVGADTNGVKNAIIAGGAIRGWTVVNSESGKLRLQFNKNNKHIVEIDILYDATGYQLKYADSKNMEYKDQAKGPVIHPFYNKWIQNLIGDIAKAYAQTASRPQ